MDEFVSASNARSDMPVISPAALSAVSGAGASQVRALQAADADEARGGTKAQEILNIAQSAEGEMAEDMINGTPKNDDPHNLSGRMLPLDDELLHFRNCANYVSAVLEAAGVLPTEMKSVNVAELVGNLRQLSAQKQEGEPGWTEVQVADNPNETQFKEGDVVAIMNPDGTGKHIMIFSHYDENGNPMFIGSHNLPTDDPDYVGPQRVETKAYDLSQYPPEQIAVFRYSDS